MKNCILFSAVGGHDPIANYHDGAILHICRTYRPKKVCLFLSKEMTVRHNLDNRYVDSLRRLQELLDFKIDHIELIKKENLTEVQLFDTFYQEFESVIRRLQAENPDHTILLNVSSGTPAMKSALEIISTLSGKGIQAVQVSTPRKSENFKNELPENYDPELYWETDEDNSPDYTNRCLELKSLNLLAKVKKEIIIKMVRSYDYRAAAQIGREIKDYISPKALKMLKAAACRSQLDIAGYNNETEGTDIDFMPVADELLQPVFEYILILQMKKAQGNYADFVRAISPVVQDSFDIYMQKNFGINYRLDYCEQTSNNSPYYPRLAKMTGEKGERVKNRLIAKFPDTAKLETSFYSSMQLLALIEGIATDTEVITAARNLRNKVESKVRNLAAHEIVSVTPQTIVNRTGMTPQAILNALHLIVEKSGFDITETHWESYESMNRQIIDNL